MTGSVDDVFLHGRGLLYGQVTDSSHAASAVNTFSSSLGFGVGLLDERRRLVPRNTRGFWPRQIDIAEGSAAAVSAWSFRTVDMSER